MSHVIFCLLLLSTGFDTLAFNTPVGSFRISIVLFMLVFFGLAVKREIKIDIKELSLFVFLLISMLVSSYFSFSPMRSVTYICWFFICYIFYFGVARTFTRAITYEGVLKTVRITGRLQIIVCGIMALVGFERPSLFYYEPSYLIIALVPYIYYSIGFFKDRKRTKFGLIDLLLLLILLFVSMSANLMLAILITASFHYIRFEVKYIAAVSVAIFLVWGFTQWYYKTHDDLLAVTLANIYQSVDVFTAVLERTGNRWPRMQIGIDVAQEYMLTGVGLGTFSDFSLSYNSFYDYTKGMEWNEPRGFPATNIFIELLAEGGGGVFVFFVLFLLYIFNAPRYLNSYEKRHFFEWRRIFIILLLLLCIESSLLRPYFWFYLGILSGLSSMIGRRNVVDE
ncbi:hypothetical protein K3H42_02940 [Aeromonas veronii]|uniref:hypothetical protein n=1 Tax=Aeromonas veronii TaxID=654 RepID=UPI001F463A39|nr:hypothetical protein [Aeromonas veronii]MCF5894078.1 hypothetical protein [Aeromonas veronii]